MSRLMALSFFINPLTLPRRHLTPPSCLFHASTAAHPFPAVTAHTLCRAPLAGETSRAATPTAAVATPCAPRKCATTFSRPISTVTELLQHPRSFTAKPRAARAMSTTAPLARAREGTASQQVECLRAASFGVILRPSSWSATGRLLPHDIKGVVFHIGLNFVVQKKKSFFCCGA